MYSKNTQKEWVIYNLKERVQLTPQYAASMKGIMRLAAIIHELREEGWNIQTTIKQSITNPKSRYAIYTLPEKRA